MLRHQDLIGKQIEEFRLDRFIDAGAMGMVFEAQDTVLNRKIALKLIRKGTEGFSEKEPFEARAVREAQAAARLSHPNIVAVYRYGDGFRHRQNGISSQHGHRKRFLSGQQPLAGSLASSTAPGSP